MDSITVWPPTAAYISSLYLVIVTFLLVGRMLVDCLAIGGNMTLIAYTLTIISIVSVLIRVNLAKDTLHLGVMVSQEGDINYSGYLPAMDIALETINNDPTLPFYFNVTLNDPMVRDDYNDCTWPGVVIPRVIHSCNVKSSI